MNKAIWGAFVAIAVGLMGYIAQDQYNEWKESEKFALEIGRQDNVFSGEAGLIRNIVNKKTLRKDSTVRISYFTIHNIGNEPIERQKVKFSFRDVKPWIGFIDAGERSSPGEVQPEADITVAAGEVNLNIPLLNPNEKHVLWLAYNHYDEPDIASRAPKLRVSIVEAAPPIFDDGDESFWEVFYDNLFYPILAFIAGGWIVSFAYNSELRTRGIDPKTFAALDTKDEGSERE